MMRGLFLSLVGLATVIGICNGRGYIWPAKPQDYHRNFDPTPRVANPVASVSSTNGSSLEEIMNELDER